MSRARMSERTVVLAVAAVVGVVIGVLGVWAQNAALVGVNYDDGIYALLARALADGDGYRLTFLPVSLPAIKYPPVYPLSLVPFWLLASSAEAALFGMKVANGVYIGLAAGLFVFLLTDLRILPVALAAALALVGFASGSMMLVTASVLSEPLYLVLLFAALWSADSVPVSPSVRRLLIAGLLVGLVVLTRAVGITLFVAVTIGLWSRCGRRPALIAALGAAILVVPWLVFTLANAALIPDVLVPRYGSYVQLYLANITDSPWAALDIFATNVGAVLQTLGVKLTSGLGPLASSLLGMLFVTLALLGSFRVFRVGPATAVYAWAYLALISVWSFPPFRFVFILVPLLLALAAVGALGLAERVASGLGRERRSPGRVSLVRYAVLGVALLVFANLAYRETRAVSRRVWDGAELQKSAVGAEVIAWVRENTDPGAVVAFEFDPLIALHSGRRAVPNNCQPVHVWYRRNVPAVERLAELLQQMDVQYLAVRRNVPMAAAPIDALMARYPESLQLIYITSAEALIFRTNLDALKRQPERREAGSASAGAALRGAEN
jgi:hypothetical protein